MRNRKYFQHNLQIDSHVAGETAKAPHNDEGISHIKAEDPEGSNTEIMAEDVVKESSGHVVDDTSQGNKGKPKEYPQEECPLNCGQSHSGGSCFSCKIFGAKTLDGRRAICRDANLCTSCLVAKSRTHTCVIQKCPWCFNPHKILLCPLSAPEKDVEGEEESPAGYSSTQIAENLYMFVREGAIESRTLPLRETS